MFDFAAEINEVLKEENNQLTVDKSYNKFSFSENDWLLDILLSNKKNRNIIFTLRDYNVKKLEQVIMDYMEEIYKYRLKHESDNFKKKRVYLLDNKENNKIQITLEDEYYLKSLIEKYKIYEFINWIHEGKNMKIIKYCILKQKEILNEIYSKIQLSIRKVIGAKVFEPHLTEFEDAVSNAWISIIKYIPKIDTTKVMFSLFIAIAHRSSSFYKSTLNKYNYDNVLLSNIKKNNDEIDDDYLINYLDKDPLKDEEFEFDNINDLIDKEKDKEIEDLIDSIDNEGENNLEKIKKLIISHSFSVLSNSSKKIIIDKIIAEFFIDLINNNINKSLLEKNSDILVNIVNLIELSPDKINNDTYNKKTMKLFKDYVKDKIAIKLKIENTKNNLGKKDYVDRIIKREKSMLKALSEEKNILDKLFAFKNKCLIIKK